MNQPIPSHICPTCGSEDVGICSLYGGYWCENGHNVPECYGREKALSKTLPIRIGDRFNVAGAIYEVIGTKPGGKIELFDRVRCRFTDRYHRDVKDWERVTS